MALAVISTPVAGILNVSVSYVHVHVKFSYHGLYVALTVTTSLNLYDQSQETLCIHLHACSVTV